MLYKIGHRTDMLADKKNSSCCRSDGIVVASYTRGPRFESSYGQNFYIELVLTVSRWKDGDKEKEAGNCPST